MSDIAGVKNRSVFWQYPVAWIVAAIFSLPLIVMMSGALKSSEELARNPYGLWPTQDLHESWLSDWQWSNFPAALEIDAVFYLPF